MLLRTIPVRLCDKWRSSAPRESPRKHGGYPWRRISQSEAPVGRCCTSRRAHTSRRPQDATQHSQVAAWCGDAPLRRAPIAKSSSSSSRVQSSARDMRARSSEESPAEQPTTAPPPEVLEQAWRDYTSACQESDLRGAVTSLERLKAVGAFQGPERRALEALGLCLQPGAEEEVSRLFQLLQECGQLAHFGASEPQLGPVRRVTPQDLEGSTSLPPSAFSPARRSTLPRNAALLLGAGLLSRVGALPPVLAVVSLAASLATVDFYLNDGKLLAAARERVAPGQRERVVAHEAGHLVVAYLLRRPVRGVVLDTATARRAGLPGVAGTLFWDASLQRGLLDGRLSARDFDIYTLVLFAGIAAEALRYGGAEGGGSDEELFRSVVGELRPPWPRERVSNQARWAVGEAAAVLRANHAAYGAARGCLLRGGGLAECVWAIERSFDGPPAAADGDGDGDGDGRHVGLERLEARMEERRQEESFDVTRRSFDQDPTASKDRGGWDGWL